MDVATSKDIARIAGVSQATVSRVLQNMDNVDESTRQRVLDALRETGYVPNLQARAMRMRRSGLIGVVTGRLTNPFYPELLDALAEEITSAGLRMALWTTDEPASSTVAVQAIQGSAIDGLIFTTATSKDPALRQAVAQQLPIVLVNRSIARLQCDQVTSDNVAGGRLVAEYFLAHGRTSVAVVGGDDIISTSRERRRGFTKAFAQQGIEIPAHRQRKCDFTHDAARKVGLELLGSDDRPAAVFCVNDLVAFGVQDAAHQLGIAVPDTLWIAGYDDIPMAAWDRIDMTSVRQPIDELAKLAVDTLVRRIKKHDMPFSHRRFSAELMVRGSTGWAPAHD
ncbi:LacI family transcriptional regulator [Nocardioides gansuensis]|uniref:LacI family transcriptional regulator n=1 Tax=Nocardioides gansuensis TaxID=2138300 RepID=A0A2T8F625_9ACTN|nr:LacI family transcriptional regulator [Nocardioides gansuensis]